MHIPNLTQTQPHISREFNISKQIMSRAKERFTVPTKCRRVKVKRMATKVPTPSLRRLWSVGWTVSGKLSISRNINCGLHGNVEVLKAARFQFLPANITSVLQPTDQRVIEKLEVHYHKCPLVRRVLCFNEKRYSVNHLYTKRFLVTWQAVTDDCQRFRRAGFYESETALRQTN